MATFLVFRHLPGVTRDQYAAAQRAVGDAVGQISTYDRELRYLGGFFIPATAWAICVLSADSLADVTIVNERAGVPFTAVLEAIELRTQGEEWSR